MIVGYKGKTYTERLEKLGITSLMDRHNRADMIQVYKILNDKSNIYPTNFLVKSNRAGRKNSLKLFKKRCNLDLSKYSFISPVIDQWNKLPDKVVLSLDVDHFKGKLDCHMRSNRGLD